MGVEMLINGPVPGCSLTVEPGNAPWEQPPKYVELADVVDYYSDKLVSKDSLKNIKDAADTGIPMADIAEVMLKNGVMKGIHSIDVGYISFPIIVELLKTVAEIAGATQIVIDSEEKELEVDEETFRQVMNEAKMNVAEKASSVSKKGLMAKGEE